MIEMTIYSFWKEIKLKVSTNENPLMSLANGWWDKTDTYLVMCKMTIQRMMKKTKQIKQSKVPSNITTMIFSLKV